MSRRDITVIIPKEHIEGITLNINPAVEIHKSDGSVLYTSWEELHDALAYLIESRRESHAPEDAA
jgi:hypothetical protein